MRDNNTILGLVLTLSVSASIFSGCSKIPFIKKDIPEPIQKEIPKPPPAATIINADIRASVQVNPDHSGRASPIVVRLYELKSLSVFNSVDFMSLYKQDEQTLGGDLIHKAQFILRPGGNKIYTRNVKETTQYLGVMAAFRNINQSVWKSAVPVPTHKTTNFTIVLDAIGLSIQAE